VVAKAFLDFHCDAIEEIFFKDYLSKNENLLLIYLPSGTSDIGGMEEKGDACVVLLIKLILSAYHVYNNLSGTSIRKIGLSSQILNALSSSA